MFTCLVYQCTYNVVLLTRLPFLDIMDAHSVLNMYTVLRTVTAVNMYAEDGDCGSLAASGQDVAAIRDGQISTNNIIIGND